FSRTWNRRISPKSPRKSRDGLSFALIEPLASASARLASASEPPASAVGVVAKHQAPLGVGMLGRCSPIVSINNDEIRPQPKMGVSRRKFRDYNSLRGYCPPNLREDRSMTRRLLGGLVATTLAFVLIARADDPTKEAGDKVDSKASAEAA